MEVPVAINQTAAQAYKGASGANAIPARIATPITAPNFNQVFVFSHELSDTSNNQLP
jgi:hypothetical protein